jgi:RNA polymerase sigma-70 factor (ECF subfamily)
MAPRRVRETRADVRQSFEQLYRGHRADVYRAALRELGNVHDAEDVTQAAFVDAYRAVLRGTRPDAPRAWLLTIAENVRRRRFRTAMRRPREEPLDADAALAADQPEDDAGALLDALHSLTDEQRRAFLLREIAGLSYDEIASRTGSTVASVQMLLFRARKSLRSELEPRRLHPLLAPLTSFMSRFEGLGSAPRAAGAIGAAAVAIGVGSSGPAQADPQPVAPKAPVPAVLPADATPRTVPAPPPRRAVARAVPAPEPSVVILPAPEPAVAPRAIPAPPAATGSSSASERPAPAVSVPTLEPPTLEAPALPALPLEPAPLVDALVEDALVDVLGAAGSAGADAPPLPELPLGPVPPLP